MKFTVRKGFVINLIEIKEIGDEKQEVRNTYAGGEGVDFDEATATAHLHKLEPADKAATAFVEKRTVPAPSATSGVDTGAIAAAVAAALQAMGIVAQPQKAAA
jgi:hypothetical protein